MARPNSPLGMMAPCMVARIAIGTVAHVAVVRDIDLRGCVCSGPVLLHRHVVSRGYVFWIRPVAQLALTVSGGDIELDPIEDPLQAKVKRLLHCTRPSLGWRCDD